VTAQLNLFTDIGGGAPDARMNRNAAGLRKGIPPGAERLLGELVKRGLLERDLKVAALLALALDEGGREARP
jgi:hypothetical protein